MTAPIKGSSGDNKNRSVDEQREEQCNSRVDRTEKDCLPLKATIVRIRARGAIRAELQTTRATLNRGTGTRKDGET